ncbi:MAG: lysine--tRNA ligase [Phycisphaerae bacterium]
MLEKVQADRRKKLEQIRQLGIDPFGGRYTSNEPIANILDRYQEDTEGQTADAAGRLILIRDMGKMMFCHLRDESGQMQIAFRKNALDEQSWKLAKLLDLGDIVAASGMLQKSRTGEITIWADKLTLLTKSLMPMPEKFHGLQDVETRYRRRYLDLMTNPQSLNNFKKRIGIIEHFRGFLKDKGFSEVETPMMQPVYGGAAARPFTTHHNALDADLFLRISPETYLKRLLVGGMEKIFEINRNFRNEGIDTSHNPEFTMMELYEAYADYEDMMELTENLVSSAAEKFLDSVPQQVADLTAAVEAEKEKDEENFSQERLDELNRCLAVVAEAEGLIAEGKIALPYGDIVLDYTTPWRRAKYADLLKEHAGVDMDDIDAVRAKAKELGIEPENKDDAVVVNEVFEETVEEHLVQPTFVIDYPADICPLTRRKTDDPSIALRFEAFAATMELANAYTELNDPDIQEENFRRQVRGEAGDETMRVMDEDFILAMRHGMPPAGGLGVGIDRIAMLLTNTQSIRDVILFPQLRPGAAKPPADKPLQDAAE